MMPEFVDLASNKNSGCAWLGVAAAVILEVRKSLYARRRGKRGDVLEGGAGESDQSTNKKTETAHRFLETKKTLLLSRPQGARHRPPRAYLGIIMFN